MIQAYPYQLSDAGNGAVMVRFVDVPELIVQADGEEMAKQWAARDLQVALKYYADEGRKIPHPSKPKKGQHLAYLPPLVAMKLEIYQAMRDQGLSRVKLAERMGVDEKQVRRLLDLDHQSRISQIDDALRVLGKALVVDVRDAAIA